MPDLFGNEELTPIISLWQPWAQWVMLGWKPIETRLHRRFYSLAGKRIGIHASATWDEAAMMVADLYLWDWQRERTKAFDRKAYGLLGTAFCSDARELSSSDSEKALIDCEVIARHGLILEDPKPFALPIPMKGKQGIWYAKLPAAQLPTKGE